MTKPETHKIHKFHGDTHSFEESLDIFSDTIFLLDVLGRIMEANENDPDSVSCYIPTWPQLMLLHETYARGQALGFNEGLMEASTKKKTAKKKKKGGAK